MRAFLVALAAFAFAPAVHAQPAASDPLAPARAGMVQCYTPVAATKGCRAIGAYRFQTDGSILEDSVTLIAPSPLIVMHMSQPVTVREGMTCGQFHLDDVDAATFEIDGAPANAEQTQRLHDALKPALAPMAGEVCETYAPQGEGIGISGQLNGQPLAAMHDVIVWVRPSDGYAVRAP